jgi:hypothetical protein
MERVVPWSALATGTIVDAVLAKAGVEHSIGIIKRVFGFAKSLPLA